MPSLSGSEKRTFAVAREALFSMKYLDEFAAMTPRRLAPAS